MEKLKNKVYELEGLLELASIRRDKQEALWPLIEMRINDINQLWSEANPAAVDDETSDDKEPEMNSDDSEAIAESPAEEISWTQSPVVEGELDVVTEENRIQLEKLKLCVNDRFRYSPLFKKGGESCLDDVLDRLKDMHDVEEAREYILSEYDLDPDDEVVSDFLDLLTVYYS